MPVETTPPGPAGRQYDRPTLTPLGTLADLTRGTGGPNQNDALGDESGDSGSV